MKKIVFVLLFLSTIMTAQDITLPTPLRSGGVPLMEALEHRASARDFSSKDIDPQTLSDMLWAAWGYNRDGRRTAPSSHNRQEISVYVALKSGTYVYDALNNVLQMAVPEDLRSLTGTQDFVGKAPVNLIFVANLSKITGKDERGASETAFVNTGFISQNVYLFCASAGLSTVTRAMVDKPALAAKLGLGKSHIITLCQTVGWPNTSKSVKVPFVSDLDKADSGKHPLGYEQIRDIMKGKGSRGSIDVVNWPTYPYCPGASFSIARSTTHLFVSFMVVEKSIRAVGFNDNDPVYMDSCVEFFVQIPGHKEYFNFETNCIGTMHAAKRMSRTEKAMFPPDTMDMILRYTSLPRKAFEEMTLGDEDAEKCPAYTPDGFKYNVIIGIPFAVLGLDGNNLPEKIMGNFYKCGDKLSDPHFISWNPILIDKPDFHRPEFFGELMF